ncbi:hypothetical protein B0T25DRAFT_61082 [Lasiosphaeria hispida]|uniref:Uncharacterized protein n=1 Tax=Lasiosphaeria hispida TaxID=260671 RepID=A0AAJ0HX55_9PEZI|nr:hypothetical protein B0T25DRAFT_61082 [Lasiosphaeria hispida]
MHTRSPSLELTGTADDSASDGQDVEHRIYDTSPTPNDPILVRRTPLMIREYYGRVSRRLHQRPRPLIPALQPFRVSRIRFVKATSAKIGPNFGPVVEPSVRASARGTSVDVTGGCRQRRRMNCRLVACPKIRFDHWTFPTGFGSSIATYTANILGAWFAKSLHPAGCMPAQADDGEDVCCVEVPSALVQSFWAWPWSLCNPRA